MTTFNYFARSQRALLLTFGLLLLVLPGCVGRREALRMNASLETVSDQASEQIKKLKEAARTEAAARIAANDALRKAVADVYSGQRRAIVNLMTAMPQKTLAEINLELAKQQKDLADGLKAQQSALEPTITTSMKPLYDKVALYKKKADDAFEKLRVYPADLELRKNSALADKDYVTAHAKVLDIKLDAFKAGIAKLNDENQNSVRRLQEIAGDHRKNVGETTQMKLTATPNAPSADFLERLTVPEANSAAYDDLVKFSEAVHEAAKANQDYLRSNSLGAGSFFESAFRSFFRGFTGGLINPASVKDLKWEDAVKAGQDVFTNFIGEFKGELEAIKGNFAKTAGEETRKLLDQATQKAIDTATHFVNTKLGELDPGK